MPLSGPQGDVARDIVDGQKLALAEAGGTAGPFSVNFASLDLGADADPERVAGIVREAMRDPAIIAAISDLDSDTARVSIPLLNAAGVLHLSPGATYDGFVAPNGPGEPQRWRPSRQATFVPLAPPDSAQAAAIARAAGGSFRLEEESGTEWPQLRAFASNRGDAFVYSGVDRESAEGVVAGLLREEPRARVLMPERLLRAGVRGGGRVRLLTSAPPATPEFLKAFERRFGRCAGRYAKVGYDAMRSVLAVIDRLGERARRRDAVTKAYLQANPVGRTAAAPWALVGDAGCGSGYEPVG